MDDTYGQFLDYLKKNSSKIRSSMILDESSDLRKRLEPMFHEMYHHPPPYSFKPLKVAATDSSEFIRELYNGKKIFLIRSFTKMGNRVWNHFISEVIDVDREVLRNFTILLMEHSEHLSTLKMMGEDRPDYILLDGSLVGRMRHRNQRIKAENYEDFMEEYFETLSKLVESCINRNIPLIFVAKSSESRILRDFIIKKAFPGGEVNHLMTMTDHVIVRSLSKRVGFTSPIKISLGNSGSKAGKKIGIATFHIMPHLRDVPIKIDIVLPELQNDLHQEPEIVHLQSDLIGFLFWGYSGLKIHNIWLAEVDRSVKFNHREIEDLYMKTFEREVGIEFYETRGERRARIRI
ncbi:DNA double-strand break repair nuclease NurA [Oxyplasma meridianum]|uniref:DNA double-strand break repair nuclease NurA n=1 Tax=Oxyplasma meridianum TaxID=3073602 RepID=A0AAX4NDI4_9ARCH